MAVEVPPNKKFIYYEDNGDGTITATFSLPELDVFMSMTLLFDFDEMARMAIEEVPEDLQQRIIGDIVLTPSDLEAL